MISVISTKVTADIKEYTVTLTEKLCKPFCVLSTVEPIVNVEYSVDKTQFIDGYLYATIKAQGTVTYVSKNGCACDPCTKIFTEYFVVSFEDATCTDCVLIKKIPGVSSPAYVNCCNVACGISATNVVSITLAAAPAFRREPKSKQN